MKQDDVVRLDGSTQSIGLPDGRFVAGVSRIIPSDDRNYESVVYQQGRPLLDSELNLTQQIVQSGHRALTRTMLLSGRLSDLMPRNNANSVLLSISGGDVLVDGMLYTLDDGQTPGDLSVTVALSPKPGEDRTDSVYVLFYREEVASANQLGNQREDIKLHGNLNGQSVQNDLLDPALPGGLESTRRVQRSYRIVSVLGTGLGNLRPLDVDGNPVNGLNFVPAQYDPTVLIAGDGTREHAALIGSVDGHVYAMELARVARHPADTSVQASNVTVMLPRVRFTPQLSSVAASSVSEVTFGNVQMALDAISGALEEFHVPVVGGTDGHALKVVGSDGTNNVAENASSGLEACLIRAGGRFFAPGTSAYGAGLNTQPGVTYYVADDGSLTSNPAGRTVLAGNGLTNNRLLVRLIPLGADVDTGGEGGGTPTSEITMDFTYAQQGHNANFNGEPVQFHLNASSTGGAITGIVWHFYPGDIDRNAAGADPLWTMAAGTTPVTVTVTDALGASKSLTKQVTVVAAAGGSAGINVTPNGNDVTFQAVNMTGNTAPNGNVSWEVRDNNTGTSVYAAGPSQFTYHRPDTSSSTVFTVYLSFPTAQGTFSTNVTFGLPLAPKGDISGNITLTTDANTNKTFHINGLSTSNGAAITNFHWDFGNGVPLDTNNANDVSHTYPRPGGQGNVVNYTVNLTMSGPNLTTKTISRVVDVAGPDGL